LGYWLGREFQGCGVMTDCCRAVIQHLFAELQLNRVEIHCAAANAKSGAIPRRLGFALEGTEREAQYLNGQFVDQLIYAILRCEWKPISD
ncbi:MAG TPA: GNAT family protein, partial [Bryobacteraceae bacterium]|nr:GNAT family protein [Bryobacteraceae bacterium]